MAEPKITAALAASEKLREGMLQAFYALRAEVDEAYRRAAPIEEQLKKAVAATQKCQAAEAELAAMVEQAWGPHHAEAKREMARLANALRFIPHQEGYVPPPRP